MQKRSKPKCRTERNVHCYYYDTFTSQRCVLNPSYARFITGA